jgi:hypothetical protein
MGDGISDFLISDRWFVLGDALSGLWAVEGGFEPFGKRVGDLLGRGAVSAKAPRDTHRRDA